MTRVPWGALISGILIIGVALMGLTFTEVRIIREDLQESNVKLAEVSERLAVVEALVR